jgi:hypothetical protein
MSNIIDFQSVLKARASGLGISGFIKERKMNIQRFTPEELDFEYLEYEMDGDDEGWLVSHPFIRTEDIINPLFTSCTHGKWHEPSDVFYAECLLCGLKMWAIPLTQKNPANNLDSTTKLQILYEVEINKSRIADQAHIENREWALYVFDRLQNDWIQVNSLNTPEEKAFIKTIRVLDS